LNQLEGNSHPTEVLIGIIAVGAVRVEHGQSVGKIALGKVMVRDNAVHTQHRGSFNHLEGLDTRVDADNELDTFLRRLLDHRRLHPVPILKTPWNVIARVAPEHVERFAQDDHCSGAVNIIIAVDQDALPGLYGYHYPTDGGFKV
jgi:hypothetical protein